jgi:hypothetical protein
MDKQNYIYSYNGMLLDNEGEWSADNMVKHGWTLKTLC